MPNCSAGACLLQAVIASAAVMCNSACKFEVGPGAVRSYIPSVFQESEQFSPELLLLFRTTDLQVGVSGKRALFTRIIIIIPNAGAAAPEFRKASTFPA